MKNTILTILLLVFYSLAFSQAGFLDSTFGTGGKVTTDFYQNGLNYGTCLAIQSDNKSLAGGYVYNGTDYDFALVRYNVNGTLDTSFGNGGMVTTNVSNNDYANAIAIQSDGKILLAGGVSGVTNNPNSFDFGIVRYNADGSLDPSFGYGGIVITNIYTDQFSVKSSESISSIAIQADSKILASGCSTYGGATSIYIARYDPSGFLDVTYGDTGLAGGYGVGSDQVLENPVPISLLSNGKSIVGFTARNSSTGDYGQLYRLLTNGKIDTSYHSISLLTYPNKLIAEPNMTTLVVGNYTSSGQSVGLSRLDSTGSADHSLAPYGSATFRFFGHDSYGNDAVEQPDGKIVIVGYYNTSQQDSFALARLENNGTVDNTFGNAGEIVTYFARSNNYAYAVALQSDGKIVVNGAASQGTFGQALPSDFATSRYLSSPVTPTSVTNISTNGEFVIYPNPSNGSFKIDWESALTSTVLMTIYDLEGRELSGALIAANSTEYSFNEHINPGVYLVKINDGEKINLVKIVIN